MADPFPDVLKELEQLHNQKAADYGSDDDPYANIRASAEVGIEPWVSAFLRLNDKIMRVKSFIKRGNLFNESLADNLIDISVYSVIMLIMFRDKESALRKQESALRKQRIQELANKPIELGIKPFPHPLGEK